MAILKLKKKKYLGEGYTHQFKNDLTGEIVFVPTTKEQYESMGIKGGEKNNPTLAGHTWQSSSGGTFKVDNPDTVLKEGEYIEVGDGVIIRVAHPDIAEQWKKASKIKMSDEGEIEEKDLTKL